MKEGKTSERGNPAGNDNIMATKPQLTSQRF